MSAIVLSCGKVFDGISDRLAGPTEILVDDGRIAEIGRSVHRPSGATVIDLSNRTAGPGFIDTHVHLTMDASNLALQTLESSAAKALKGLGIAREYMRFSHGILEFQAMVAAGLSPLRALKAATSVAAEMLNQDDIGVLAVGKQADIVAMPGDPLTDISVTAKVDFVMKGGVVYRDRGDAADEGVAANRA